MHTKMYVKSLLAALCTTVAVSALSPVTSEAQPPRYSVAPLAQYLSWNDEFPLEKRWLYGGKLNIDFGSQIELQPFYMRTTGLKVDSAPGVGIFGPQSVSRELRLEHFGASVQLNLGPDEFAPFVRGGGGLLRFEPDSGDKIRRITLLAGAGLRVNLGGIRGEVFAEQFRFRMSPGRLFGNDTSTVAKAPVQRGTSYGAAITIPLSSFSEDVEPSALRGTRAPFEPFIGRLAFDGDLGLAKQELIGIRTGIDFSPLFGLRGFYWRGTNEDRDGTDPIAGYGGEAQFNLNDGRGVSPYIVLGAGRIDFLKDFRDPAGDTRDDVTALIVGGGASFALTDRIRINASIRDYVTSIEEKLTTTKDPDDLLHNRMLSAGFTFSVGGSSGSDRAPVRRSTPAATTNTNTVSAADQRELNRLRAENAALRQSTARRDTVVVRDGSVRAPTAIDSDTRFIVVPVPEVGEIIIRYGSPVRRDMMGSPRIIREMMIDTVRVNRELRRDDRDPGNERREPEMRSRTDTLIVNQGSSQDARVMESRLRELENRLDEARTRQQGDPDVQARLRALELELEEARSARRQMEERMGNMSQNRTPERVVENRTRDSNSQSFGARLAAIRPADIRPFAGFGSGGGPGSQFVVSARADLGPLSAGSRLDLVPEIALGLGGDGTTLLAFANLRYSFLTSDRIRPYVMGGAGLYTESLVGIGTSVGTSINLRSAGQSPLYGFAELQGLNFFDHTRILFGVSTTY